VRLRGPSAGRHDAVAGEEADVLEPTLRAEEADPHDDSFPRPARSLPGAYGAPPSPSGGAGSKAHSVALRRRVRDHGEDVGKLLRDGGHGG
jgi:hypothetical protein